MTVLSTPDGDPTGLSGPSIVPVLLVRVFPMCPPPHVISRRPGVSWTLTRG